MTEEERKGNRSRKGLTPRAIIVSTLKKIYRRSRTRVVFLSTV